MTKGSYQVRTTRRRLAVAGTLALALGVGFGSGSAQAAKVSETAAGGLVPPLIDPPAGATTSVPFVQSFTLKGGKVKSKQTLDVDVTVNGFGNGLDSNQDLTALLVGPKGDHVALPVPNIGSGMSNLKFDSQSLLTPCNPLAIVSENCNYLQGGNAGGTIGTMTGSLNADIKPVFKGGNPKGTWRLIWRDFNDNPVTTTLGTTTLEVKTGKKFAKEG
jgi:hypothetical protein